MVVKLIEKFKNYQFSLEKQGPSLIGYSISLGEPVDKQLQKEAIEHGFQIRDNKTILIPKEEAKKILDQPTLSKIHALALPYRLSHFPDSSPEFEKVEKVIKEGHEYIRFYFDDVNDADTARDLFNTESPIKINDKFGIDITEANFDKNFKSLDVTFAEVPYLAPELGELFPGYESVNKKMYRVRYHFDLGNDIVNIQFENVKDKNKHKTLINTIMSLYNINKNDYKIHDNKNGYYLELSQKSINKLPNKKQINDIFELRKNNLIESELENIINSMDANCQFDLNTDEVIIRYQNKKDYHAAEKSLNKLIKSDIIPLAKQYEKDLKIIFPIHDLDPLDTKTAKTVKDLLKNRKERISDYISGTNPIEVENNKIYITLPSEKSAKDLQFLAAGLQITLPVDTEHRIEVSRENYDFIRNKIMAGKETLAFDEAIKALPLSKKENEYRELVKAAQKDIQKAKIKIGLNDKLIVEMKYPQIFIETISALNQHLNEKHKIKLPKIDNYNEIHLSHREFKTFAEVLGNNLADNIEKYYSDEKYYNGALYDNFFPEGKIDPTKVKVEKDTINLNFANEQEAKTAAKRCGLSSAIDKNHKNRLRMTKEDFNKVFGDTGFTFEEVTKQISPPKVISKLKIKDAQKPANNQVALKIDSSAPENFKEFKPKAHVPKKPDFDKKKIRAESIAMIKNLLENGSPKYHLNGAVTLTINPFSPFINAINDLNLLLDDKHKIKLPPNNDKGEFTFDFTNYIELATMAGINAFEQYKMHYHEALYDNFLPKGQVDATKVKIENDVIKFSFDNGQQAQLAVSLLDRKAQLDKENKNIVQITKENFNQIFAAKNLNFDKFSENLAATPIQQSKKTVQAVLLDAFENFDKSFSINSDNKLILTVEDKSEAVNPDIFKSAINVLKLPIDKNPGNFIISKEAYNIMRDDTIQSQNIPFAMPRYEVFLQTIQTGKNKQIIREAMLNMSKNINDTLSLSDDKNLSFSVNNPEDFKNAIKRFRLPIAEKAGKFIIEKNIYDNINKILFKNEPMPSYDEIVNLLSANVEKIKRKEEAEILPPNDPKELESTFENFGNPIRDVTEKTDDIPELEEDEFDDFDARLRDVTEETDDIPDASLSDITEETDDIEESAMLETTSPKTANSTEKNEKKLSTEDVKNEIARRAARTAITEIAKKVKKTDEASPEEFTFEFGEDEYAAKYYEEKLRYYDKSIKVDTIGKNNTIKLTNSQFDKIVQKSKSVEPVEPAKPVNPVKKTTPQKTKAQTLYPIRDYKLFDGGLTYYPFYDKDKPGYCFANFFDKPLEIERQDPKNSDKTIKDIFITPEHYFQAQKFLINDNDEYNDKYKVFLESVLHAPTPRKAAEAGRNGKLEAEDVKKWDERSHQAMRNVVKARAEQDETFKNTLLATEDAYLVEDTYYNPDGKPDKIWGCGPDHDGKNLLGWTLMEQRENLKRGGGYDAANDPDFQKKLEAMHLKAYDEYQDLKRKASTTGPISGKPFAELAEISKRFGHVTPPGSKSSVDTSDIESEKSKVSAKTVTHSVSSFSSATASTSSYKTGVNLFVDPYLGSLISHLTTQKSLATGKWETDPDKLEKSVLEVSKKVGVVTAKTSEGNTTTGFKIEGNTVTIPPQYSNKKDSYKAASETLSAVGIKLVAISAPGNNRNALIAATTAAIEAGLVPVIESKIAGYKVLHDEIIALLAPATLAKYNNLKSKIDSDFSSAYEESYTNVLKDYPAIFDDAKGKKISIANGGSTVSPVKCLDITDILTRVPLEVDGQYYPCALAYALATQIDPEKDFDKKVRQLNQTFQDFVTNNVSNKIILDEAGKESRLLRNSGMINTKAQGYFEAMFEGVLNILEQSPAIKDAFIKSTSNFACVRDVAHANFVTLKSGSSDVYEGENKFAKELINYREELKNRAMPKPGPGAGLSG